MSRKMTIKTAAVAAALGAMTTVAWAESIKLTDAQMDQVTAGVGHNQTHWNYNIMPSAGAGTNETHTASTASMAGSATLFLYPTNQGSTSTPQGIPVLPAYVRGDGSYFP